MRELEPTYSKCHDDFISEDGRCNTCSRQVKVESETEEDEFDLTDYLSEEE